MISAGNDEFFLLGNAMTPFLGPTGICTNLDPVPRFFERELYIILKLKIVKVGEHSSFLNF